MTTTEGNLEVKKFNRGLAFAASLICCILGFAFVLFIPLSYGGPVPGHPELREAFAPAYETVFWLVGLVATILIPIAVWKRIFTAQWWMYPFFLVTFCVVLAIFVLVCASHGIGITIISRPPTS
jgi:hypothetical protein